MSSNNRIPLSEPYLAGNVRKYLEECIASNFVSSVGPFVSRFEEEFARLVGARHAVACASGTAALHLAMRVAGVVDGDEVFVPSLTFIASANPIRYERATAVLCDSEEETWNLDPDLVADEIVRRARAGQRLPRAVEVVHLLGHPARMEPLVDVCARNGVILIEDASEALGAKWTHGSFAGRHVGTVGQIGCFSFNGNKIVTAGGGGMIVTDDERLAQRAKHLSTQARLPGPEYRHDEIGYNYRLTNIAAAIGLAQLEMLSSFVERKAEIAARYDAALRELDGISLPPRCEWASSTTWLYTILVDEQRRGGGRDALIARLQRAAIEARPIWSPVHTLAPFRDAPRLGSGRIAERLFARGLSLPSSVTLTIDDQQRVIDVLRGDDG
jgi:dTDP-4-amino-4,6-dideoxygalactose transaminase